MDKKVVDAKAKILVLRPNNDIRIISPPPLGGEFVLHQAGGLLFDDGSVEFRVNSNIVNAKPEDTETLDQVVERLLKPFRKRELRVLKKEFKNARRPGKPVHA